MIFEYIGLFGAFLILSSWVYETAESIIKHKKLVDLRFALLYLSGNLLLLVYSISINDFVFSVLNGMIAFFVIVELIYSFVFMKKKR